MNTNKQMDDVGEKQFDLVLGKEQTDTNPRAKKTAPTSKTNAWSYLSLASGLGFDVALPMAGGLFIGVKIDERWGTQPKATLICLVLGVLVSCTSLIRIVRNLVHKR